MVIVNYKTAALTVACLHSLEPEIRADPSIRVVVVDNASGDGDELRTALDANQWHSWMTLDVAERNGGFAYGNNRAIAAAMRTEPAPDYYLLLNPDTEVRPGAVETLSRFLDENPGVGIAGGSFENEHGIDWPIAFRFPTLLGQLEQGLCFSPLSKLLRNHIVAKRMGSQPEKIDWVAGASMMVRREVFEDIGLLDEGYFLYFEEVDFCLRANRAGWPCWYVPKSRVMHISGQSTGVSAAERSLKRMPAYWFESRTRYFVKNHGLAYSRLVDLAFGVGRSIWTLRRRLVGRPSGDPPGMIADFWRTSVVFQRRSTVIERLNRQGTDSAPIGR